jgi:hypothetical protein
VRPGNHSGEKETKYKGNLGTLKKKIYELSKGQ